MLYDGEKHDDTGDFHKHGFIATLFFHHVVSSLIRSNFVWESMMVDKAFCKSSNGSLSKNFVCREGKSISKGNVYASKSKTLPFLWWKLSYAIDPHQVASWSPWEMVPYWGFNDGLWYCKIGHSAVNFHLVVQVHVHEPIEWWQEWLGKETGIHRTSYYIHLIIKILLCSGDPFLSIHIKHKHLSFFDHSHTSSPNFLVTNFLIMFFSWPSS